MVSDLHHVRGTTQSIQRAYKLISFSFTLTSVFGAAPDVTLD
jgi:hypothetical protein